MPVDPTPKRPVRVLVADDSLVNRRILEAMLKAEGLIVLQAKDGAEAVEVFEREQPDLVFLDALMPNMDGREAARRIKAACGARLVPIVFVTALEDDNDLESCVEAGADDFLTKPFDAAVLRTKLKLLNRLRDLQAGVSVAGATEPASRPRLVRTASEPMATSSRKSRVLVIDDSALMRQVLGDILGRDPGLEVVGTAADPYVAWEKIQLLRPDVLTLDVDMPRMDGITFLEKLMRLRPMPVVMVSSLTEKGCQTTLRALELGAIDFVAKPRLDPLNGTLALADEIARKVRTASRARIHAPPRAWTRREGLRAVPGQGAVTDSRSIVVVGASTGGTQAIEELLSALPEDAPGVVCVQHMPEGFTARFAERLDGRCRVRVREAADGDVVRRGEALIAPGNLHVELAAAGAGFSVRTLASPLVNGHRPAVDVLFHSTADVAGPRAVGVLLTGMGGDGARGMLALRRAGARTVAQDEATCVVFGMPKEAIALDAVDLVLPLERIAEALLREARKVA